MEKNWIEKTKEAIEIAMNKKKPIGAYYDKDNDAIGFRIKVDDYDIHIDFHHQKLSVYTRNGYMCIDYNLTDRNKLELQDLVLSVKEYKEDMAISEFENFISKKEEMEKITDIDNLDDDD